MSEFCEEKGIKKEFSAARTPQQNGVAKRRNKTLIENRVLVVKPHNKTPYELYRGRTLALSFMIPFRTRKVEENLHIMLLEDKPIIAGDGPKWLFDIDVLTKSMNYVPVVASTNSNDLVGTEESIGAGHSSKDTRSSQDYILMPLDAEKKDDEGVNKESGIDDQERPKIVLKILTVTTAPLEATHADFFGDETEVDMSNITTAYLVPFTPNTRIHKDHSLDHVIGDVQSCVKTMRMTNTTNEQGFM
ncbi:putative ribonuclease H-like domain-containing protein, partial [Tanacetum coccineum]